MKPNNVLHTCAEKEVVPTKPLVATPSLHITTLPPQLEPK